MSANFTIKDPYYFTFRSSNSDYRYDKIKTKFSGIDIPNNKLKLWTKTYDVNSGREGELNTSGWVLKENVDLIWDQEWHDPVMGDGEDKRKRFIIDYIGDEIYLDDQLFDRVIGVKITVEQEEFCLLSNEKYLSKTDTSNLELKYPFGDYENTFFKYSNNQLRLYEDPEKIKLNKTN